MSLYFSFIYSFHRKWMKQNVYEKNTSCLPGSVRAVETEHRRRWQRSQTESEPTSGRCVTSGDFEKPGNLERPRVATAMPSFVLQKQSSDCTVPLVLSSIFMESNLSATGRWTTSFRICNQLRVHLPGGPVDFQWKFDARARARHDITKMVRASFIGLYFANGFSSELLVNYVTMIFKRPSILWFIWASGKGKGWHSG